MSKTQFKELLEEYYFKMKISKSDMSKNVRAEKIFLYY